MAYCRFSDGDVYLVQTMNPNVDEWECMACRLDPSGESSVLTTEPEEMWAHLYTHLEAGHKVPPKAFIGILGEINKIHEDPERAPDDQDDEHQLRMLTYLFKMSEIIKRYESFDDN